MTAKIDELKLDIEEFNGLLEKATRQKAKDVLTVEVRKLQTELSKLIEENGSIATKPVSSVPIVHNKCYEVKLNNYGWDETNTAVNLYIPLKDVHKLPSESVSCNFTEKSLDLRVFGLDNKNYHLPINNLCEKIDVERSYTKVKTDMIIISLIKKVAKTWSHVTGVEKRIKESKTPSVPDISDDSDPGAGLMNIMKKIYQEGDDEMKQTIEKAWAQKLWTGE